MMSMERRKRIQVSLLIALSGLIVIPILLSIQGTATSEPNAGQSNAAEGPPYRYYYPLVYRSAPEKDFDMAYYMTGDGRLYEVQHSTGPQARHQTQYASHRFFHTKGNEWLAEWEELWATDRFIMRGTDTSPGDGQYYTLRDDGNYGSAWAPRIWDVGGLFERNPYVTFYWKGDCSTVANKHGYQRSWLKFEAFHPTFTFPGGITLPDVVQLAWLWPTPDSKPIERYYYAHNYGLVGWSSDDRGFSYISEIHEPGARPDNSREVIPCLDTSGVSASFDVADPLRKLPPQYRVK